MFRRIITASIRKRVTKVSITRLTLLRIPLAGLAVVFLAMGLPVSNAAAGPPQFQFAIGVVSVFEDDAAGSGDVTLKLEGTITENPEPTGGPIFIPFTATFEYNVGIRNEGGSTGAGGLSVSYTGATLTLSIDGQPTVTHTDSRMSMEEDCCPGEGDGLQIGDEGNQIDPSGWSGPLFGKFITALSWDFGAEPLTAFDSLVFDQAFAPTIELFPQRFGSLNLGELAPLPTLQVGINIKPGSDPNSINTCSGGTTPVAIFGTGTLDVTTIDPDSLILASATVKMVGKSMRTLCNIEDIGSVDVTAFDNLGDPDTFDDLVCHFITIDLTDLEDTSGTADLTGNLFDGTDIEGQDAVNIVKDCDPL